MICVKERITRIICHFWLVFESEEQYWGVRFRPDACTVRMSGQTIMSAFRGVGSGVHFQRSGVGCGGIHKIYIWITIVSQKKRGKAHNGIEHRAV